MKSDKILSIFLNNKIISRVNLNTQITISGWCRAFSVLFSESHILIYVDFLATQFVRKLILTFIILICHPSIPFVILTVNIVAILLTQDYKPREILLLCGGTNSSKMQLFMLFDIFPVLFWSGYVDDYVFSFKVIVGCLNCEY